MRTKNRKKKQWETYIFNKENGNPLTTFALLAFYA